MTPDARPTSEAPPMPRRTVRDPAESRRVWDAYRAGAPIRVPVTVYADVRCWLADPAENAAGHTLAQYLRDPDLMLDLQVRTRAWLDANLLSDDPVATAETGWPVIVDFQNFLEPAWLGGTVDYALSEPHVAPFLDEDGMRALLRREPPGAFEGIGADVLRFYERFLARKAAGYEYAGLGIGSVSMPYNMGGSDGPFTVACGMRGTEAFLLDLMDRPEEADALLGWITEAIIRRIREVRAYLGEPAVADGFGIADDGIVLLSADQYREAVLPHHRRLYDALATKDGWRSAHLCGDAQRFFPILQREFGIRSFDTGFPVDFGRLYDELRPDTVVYGGPTTSLLLEGTPEEVEAEVRRILASGVMEKSRAFVLREANALAPGTPFANVNRILEVARTAGRYPDAPREAAP